MRLLEKAALITAIASLMAGCAPRGHGHPSPYPRAPVHHVVHHQVAIPWLPPTVARYRGLIEQASRRHRVDANLLAIVILVESGGDPHAVSPAGAVGLMQVMPPTARDIAARRGMSLHHEWMLRDPAYNIDLGAWYLAAQVARFWNGHPDSTVDRAAGAYNGGPRRMHEHLTTGEPLPRETQSYRRWVGGMWRERTSRGSAVFGAWWRAGGDHLVTRASRVPTFPAIPRLALTESDARSQPLTDNAR